MATVKIRYYRIRRNNRAFWEPTVAMQYAGFSSTPLGEAGPEAEAKAHALNAEWDGFKSKRPADGPAKPKYPPHSIGEAFERFKTTSEWKEKPERTQEDWDRGWKYIGPVFGQHKFTDAEYETLAIWRKKIEESVSLNEAHRAMKIWRALWKVSAAMRYCRRDDDPSLAIVNKAPKGRSQTWKEGEVIRMVKEALRRGYDALAVCICILYDGSASPVDVRSLTARQMRSDASGVWFDYSRGKTGREGVQTLSVRTQRLLEWYLLETYGGAQIMPDVVLFRSRKGSEYDKNLLAKDFRTIRKIVLPGDDRTMMDMRRTGAVEAVAGGAQGPQLSAKLANNMGQNAKLEATYAPVQVEVARQVDRARKVGRRALESK